MTILEELAEAARGRVEAAKRETAPEEMRRRAEAMGEGTGFPFRAALQKPGMSFICEVKRASPSKGVIAPDFPYLTIAAEYEAAGAAAISVLTEPTRFLGDDSYLQEIAAAVRVPVLRKDFTVDPYQIYEARVLGASAVLLICALLDDGALAEYLACARSVGLDALVETHDADEVRRALAAGAGIVGVNNRDLRTFTVDVHTSERLRPLVPDGVLFVSESGIRDAGDVARLAACGVDAVLVGETLMRAKDKRAALAALGKQGAV